MAKLTLNDLSSLTNESSAVATINNNNNALEVALENTLSRDGTSPNTMASSLDMNSNRIINLPAPATAAEPLRLQELENFVGNGSINISPYINVADYGAVGDGVTDNTAAFNAAILAADGVSGQRGGTIVIPAASNYYMFDGVVNLNTKIGVTLMGVAGRTGPASKTTLCFRGTGARFIDCRDSGGITIKDLNIYYNNAGFSGIVIDAGGNTPCVPVTGPFGSVSSWFSLESCVLGHLSPGVSTCLLNVDQAIEFRVLKNDFSAGAPAVRGPTVLAGSSTVGYFCGNQYVLTPGTTVPVLGSGDSWVFENETFEANAAGKASAFQTYGTIGGRGITFRDCWMGDVSVSGGTWLTFVGCTGVVVQGGRISGVATSCEGISFVGVNGATIQGVSFDTFSAAIDFNNTAATGINITGNSFIGCTNKITNTTNVVGLSAENNSPSISRYTSAQVLIGQSSADAAPKTISGNGTLAADGTLTVSQATNSGTVTVAQDSTTNATMFPLWATSSSGNLQPKASSNNLVWNPSAGRLGVGNSAPVSGTNLHVGPGLDSPTQTSILYVSNTGTTVFTMRDSTNDIETFLGTNSSSGGLGLFGTRTSHPLWIQTNGSNKAAFHVSGGLSVGNTTDPGTDSLGVAGSIFQAGTTTNTFGSGIAVTYNQNAPTRVSISNNSSGTAAATGFLATNGTANFEFGMRGTSQSAYGALTAGRAYMYGSADFVIMADGSFPIIFSPGGSAEQARFSASGGLSVGTTTDAGVGAVLANTSIKSKGATAGIGYATGAGGAVTQITSRTTGVTLNTATGAITLFAAAPVVGTWVSFTVTNSAVVATDVPTVAVKSGTNTYVANVSAVGAGSFQISFMSIAGTASDSPVINFAVVKGVTS